MKTVNEVSKISGVSVRTLHHYDAIGLLKPSAVTDAGYRLYDDTALERLQQILLFRELEFPLKEIGLILDSSNFDRNRALEQQIELLTLKREHLDNLIDFARGIKETGVKKMDFTAFDTSKIDEYTEKAKASWGRTAEYREFEEKSKSRTGQQERELGERLMGIFKVFGTMRDLSPADDAVQAQVVQLKAFINEHYYTCSDEILYSLGQMYAAGGDFTLNIDKACGSGTAEFVFRAITVFCGK